MQLDSYTLFNHFLSIQSPDKNSIGYGGLYDTSCYCSPHAIIPSTETSDHDIAVQYQGKADTIGSSGVCQSDSKGPSSDMGEFPRTYAGSNPERASMCEESHSSVITNRGKRPYTCAWKQIITYLVLRIILWELIMENGA
jgi:hypothetical protein